VDVKFRGARACPFLAHFRTHALNGLGTIVPRQMDPEGIVLPGPNAANPLVRDRLLAGNDIADYLWTRGQSPFPAPAELINTAVTMGLRIRHYGIDDEGDISSFHMVGSTELVDSKVRFDIGIPCGIANGASNALDAGVRRARTRATVALHQVRTRAALFGTTTVDDMPLLQSAPRMGAFNRDGQTDQDHQVGGFSNPSRRGDANAGMNTGPNAQGNRLLPTVHHMPVRGPQPARGPLAGGGGGGGPPPAPPAAGGGAGNNGAPPAPAPGPGRARDARGRFASPAPGSLRGGGDDRSRSPVDREGDKRTRAAPSSGESEDESDDAPVAGVVRV